MYPPPDPNETILEKLRKKPRLLIVWPALALLFLAAGVFLTAMNFSDNLDSRPIMALSALTAIFASGLLVLALIVWPILRWLFRKHLRLTLITLASLIALVLLFYAGEDWRGRSDWGNFKKQQEARGEKFDLASFVPPALPDDQNFAMTPIAASSYNWLLDKSGQELKRHIANSTNRLSIAIGRRDNEDIPTNANWANGTLTDLRAWQAYYRAPVQRNDQWPYPTNEFPVAPSPQSPAADVLYALQRYDSDIEELRQAAALPHSRFPLQYDNDDSSAILLPHLAALKGASQTLQLRALAELQLGQSDKAAADIQLILRLAEASRNEPFLISQLVRIVIVNIARQPIYEGLAKHQWSETQLTALDSQLAKLDFLADYQHTVRSEAAYTVHMVDYVQRTHKLSEYLQMFNAASPPEQKMIDAGCQIIPAGWFDENRLSFCQFYLQGCLPLVDMEHRQVFPAAVDALETNLMDQLNHPGPYNALEALLLLPTGRFMGDKYVFTEKFVYAQECLDLTRVAIALERYRLTHGQYPDSLAALAPQFLATVPHDIIGGGNLKYHSTNQNFILYSIGWNGIDDGGIRSPMKDGLPDSTVGDWVWQYP